MKTLLKSLTNRPAGRLSIGTYFGYGVGQVGGQIMRDTPALLLPFYMTTMLGMEAALASAVVLIAKTWVFFADPTVGVISDRSDTRWGRRRPFILAGGLIAGVSFFFLFYVPDFETQLALFVYMAALYTLMNTGFSSFSVPYLTMASEMSNDPDERTTIISFRNVALNVGLLAGGALAPRLIAAGETPRAGYEFMAAVLAAIIVVSAIWLFLGTARAPRNIASPATPSLKEQLQIAQRNRPFVVLISANILQYLSAGISYTGMLFFLTYYVGVDPFMIFPIVILLMVGVSTLFMPLLVWLASTYGKLKVYVWSLVAFAVSTQVYFFAGSDTLWPIWAGALFTGVFNTAFILMSLSLLTDTIAFDRIRSGFKREGALSAVYSATEKISFAMGAVLFGLLLSATGFVESSGGKYMEQPASAIAGIMAGFVVIPALLHLSSLLVLRHYDLPRDKLVESSAPVGRREGPAFAADANKGS